MNATKRWTRAAGVGAGAGTDSDDEDDPDALGPDADDVDAETRTYSDMRENFHALAKFIRLSQLRRTVFTRVQTTSVEAGGAGRPRRMIADAPSKKFVCDDLELRSLIDEHDVIRLLLNQVDQA